MTILPKQVSTATFASFKTDVNALQSKAAREEYRNNPAVIAEEALELAERYQSLLQQDNREGLSARRSVEILTGNVFVNFTTPSSAVEQQVLEPAQAGEWWVFTKIREVKDATVSMAYSGAESIGNAVYSGATSATNLVYSSEVNPQNPLSDNVEKKT